MTREEAIVHMKSGKKLRHKNFLPGEYLYYKDGHILTEDNCIYEEFYFGRAMFADGWEVVVD